MIKTQDSAYHPSVNLVRINLPDISTSATNNTASIVARYIESRCDTRVTSSEEAQLLLDLVIDPSVSMEGYVIEDVSPSVIRIAGGDEPGLLYGVGKLLHSSRYDQGGFSVGRWRWMSAPQSPFRAIYAATHLSNYYEAAPAQDIGQYVEDLALWGANLLIAALPAFQYSGFDDPGAQTALQHLHRLFEAARRAGLETGLTMCPNGGFGSAPEDVRATRFPDDLGRRGFFGMNCCPSSPNGRAYLLELYAGLFDCFKDVGLDYYIVWPYDEGGCGCEKCWPWGSSGFPEISREVGKLARERFPNVRSVLSTWGFDTPYAGEWEGLSEFLRQGNDWLDYIMADSHEDFPLYPLDKGVPGGLQLLNFPEISMWGRYPWGGYGANPLPQRFERLWKEARGMLAGGMPYSEGIYEDMNKVICFQFYWNKSRPAADILREYIGCEFSPDVADDLLKVIYLFEETWISSDARSIEAYELVTNIDRRLTLQACSGWRWRIVYLRALIDSEMFKRDGKLEGPVLKEAFDELTRIYHAEHGEPWTKPPVVTC